MQLLCFALFCLPASTHCPALEHLKSSRCSVVLLQGLVVLSGRVEQPSVITPRAATLGCVLERICSVPRVTRVIGPDSFRCLQPTASSNHTDLQTAGGCYRRPEPEIGLQTANRGRREPLQHPLLWIPAYISAANAHAEQEISRLHLHSLKLKYNNTIGN